MSYADRDSEESVTVKREAYARECGFRGSLPLTQERLRLMAYWLDEADTHLVMVDELVIESRYVRTNLLRLAMWSTRALLRTVRHDLERVGGGER
jgi:hypothetical protein